MKITADTNVLVRALVGDNAIQSQIAQAALDGADLVALPLSALCELVWVLSRGYKIGRADISQALRRLIGAANAAVNRPGADAGLSVHDAGGDFADGVIAFEGKWLGADDFVSFDRQAVELVAAQGRSARLLA